MTPHEKATIALNLSKQAQINSEYKALANDEADQLLRLTEGWNEVIRNGVAYDVWQCDGLITQVEREGTRPATVGDIAYINNYIRNHAEEVAAEESAIIETEHLLFITER